MALNRVVLVGRLTKDPELKYTPAGVPVATMGIAVDRFTKDESGNYEVDFFNVTAWRRTAEFAQNYLKKGRLVSVDGRLQTRSWVDQATGMKRSAVDIVADNLDPVGPRPAGEEFVPDGEHAGAEPAAAAPRAAATVAAGTPPSRPTATTAAKRPAPTPVEDDADESDPFADE
ncbi:MAG: single-strand binding protein [Chthonomonadaceae bacterium]|nr:single-strand binding protein [Chthonomonadaceae bacterium]